MVHGRQQAAWLHTAAILAQLANTAYGATELTTLDEFNPYDADGRLKDSPAVDQPLRRR